MTKLSKAQSPAINPKKIDSKNRIKIIISPLLHIIRLAIILYSLFLTGSSWWIENAYAVTPDKLGNSAEIYSIEITPSSVLAGTYPEITGFVSNTSSLKSKKHGKAVFDVMAVITYPNGIQKSVLWRNVSFTASQRKAYAFVKNYDINQVGTYKIAYSVYNSGKKYLYASLSKSFTVSNPPGAAEPVPSPGAVSKAPETDKIPQLEKESMPASANRPESQVQQGSADRIGERHVIGIGGYINTLNFSGGPSLILWPLKNLAFQGTYGFGTFTSYEARTFFRFPLAQRLHPYIGAGYIHAERSAKVIGVNTKIAEDGFTAFGGVEVPINKKVFGYIDISGTLMKLKKDVTNGASQATATVKYSPVTVCTGLVFYLF